MTSQTSLVLGYLKKNVVYLIDQIFSETPRPQEDVGKFFQAGILEFEFMYA